VHLLAAYLPREGVVLAQVQVSTAGSEVSAAPVLLASLDLRGTVVSGDANFAARPPSEKILQAKGDYLWVIPRESKSEVSGYPDPLRAPAEPSGLVCAPYGFSHRDLGGERSWASGKTSDYGQ
jgi:hypothetical protein